MFWAEQPEIALIPKSKPQTIAPHQTDSPFKSIPLMGIYVFGKVARNGYEIRQVSNLQKERLIKDVRYQE